MIVYKYLNEENTLEVIENNSVTLKKPCKFNDPFDCLFFVDDAERTKAFDLFMNYQLFRKFYQKMIIENKKSNQLKLVNNVTKDNIILTANEIKSTGIYQFNKLFSVYYKIGCKILNKSDNLLKKEFNKTIDNLLDSFRDIPLISCFSLENDSILMWSHYANKHKGSCIEFEINDTTFRTVDYAKAIKSFQLCKALEIVFGNDFLKKQSNCSDESYYDFLIEPVFTKAIDWQYEKEVRCAFSSKKMDKRIKHIIKDGEELYLLKMPKIKRIYLGCQCEKSFEQIVKEKSNGIPILKMSKLKEEYGLCAEYDKVNQGDHHGRKQ